MILLNKKFTASTTPYGCGSFCREESSERTFFIQRVLVILFQKQFRLGLPEAVDTLLTSPTIKTFGTCVSVWRSSG
jgi:hypothetical protein